MEQLELALVESTRAEANLNLLLRGLKHLAAGASAAQEANAILMQELEGLRTRMGEAYENEALLAQRVQTLENALDAATRERQSWLVQEDAFLAGLLDEHEQKLFELERQHERKLADMDLAFDELRRQYEASKTEVQQLIYERDAAVALLSEPPPSSVATPVPGAGAQVLGSIQLQQVPVLRPKPDLASRPLVGYSLVENSPDELVEQAAAGVEPAVEPREPA